MGIFSKTKKEIFDSFKNKSFDNLCFSGKKKKKNKEFCDYVNDDDIIDENNFECISKYFNKAGCAGYLGVGPKFYTSQYDKKAYFSKDFVNSNILLKNGKNK